MQSTLIKHNKLFKAGHATSFDTSKKYAIECLEGSEGYCRVVDPGHVTTGDFSFIMSFRYNNGIGPFGPFQITEGLGCRMHSTLGTFRIDITNGATYLRFDTNNNMGDGEWHTIVITVDRDGDIVYYEDLTPGLLFTDTITYDISVLDGSSFEDAGSNDDWLFGTDSAVAARFSGIDIDQIAFYDSALSSLHAKVPALHLLEGKEIGTLLDQEAMCYWKCNEGSGTTVANDGTENDTMYLVSGDVMYPPPTWITDGVI